MKTYRYKDSSGDWVRSIYPKPSEGVELVADGFIFLLLVGIALYILFTY